MTQAPDCAGGVATSGSRRGRPRGGSPSFRQANSGCGVFFSRWCRSTTPVIRGHGAFGPVRPPRRQAGLGLLPGFAQAGRALVLGHLRGAEHAQRLGRHSRPTAEKALAGRTPRLGRGLCRCVRGERVLTGQLHGLNRGRQHAEDRAGQVHLRRVPPLGRLVRLYLLVAPVLPDGGADRARIPIDPEDVEILPAPRVGLPGLDQRRFKRRNGAARFVRLPGSLAQRVEIGRALPPLRLRRDGREA